MSGSGIRVAGGLMSLELAAQCIRSGRAMSIAGDEAALAKLPRGNWIGGTTAYFIGAQGGHCSRDEVFVHLLPPDSGAPTVRRYDGNELAKVCVEAPGNGFTLLILPGHSEVHESYARHAPGYEGMYLRPLAGWVSGVHLDDLKRRKPKTAFGPDGELSERAAVAIHVPLPEGRRASVQLVNPYRHGSGPIIRFPRGGFSALGAMVNGASVSLGRYISDNSIDTRRPLVADYAGTSVNVGIRECDSASGMVSLNAPVFEGMPYRFAEPVNALAAAIEAALPADMASPAFACCAMENYVNAALEGKVTGAIMGPVSFGEIAYQLVNQSLVYLSVE